MPENSRPLLFLLLAFVVCVTQAAPADAQRSQDTLPDYAKEAVVIERLKTVMSFESDGTGVREVAGILHVLAEAGVQQLAVLRFEYTRDDEAVEVDYVKVHKPNGTVIVTPFVNIQDLPADVTWTAPIYSDLHVKHVAVKGLGVGDTLEYLVRFRSLKPQVPGQFWTEYTFTKNAIIKDEELQISIPSDKYVRVASPQIKPIVKEEAGRRIYTWKTSNLTHNDAEDKTPKREGELPSVQLTTFRNWEEVGKWYGDLQASQLAVTPEMRAKVAELAKGYSSDEDKIRAIYDFVSLRFHYVGLSFGIGRYKPHAAEEVFSNEYGDCKDKHTLLSAMLKAAGFVSWPALMNSSRKVDPDIPSPLQFNHVITVVARGQNLTWLDSTPEVAPFGVLMLNLRGKQALVIPETKPAVLMKTPVSLPFAHLDSFVAEGVLNADGTFNGRMEETTRGDTEVLLRIGFRSVPEAKWKDLTQNISYGMGFGGDVSAVTASSPEDTSKPFQFKYEYVRKNYSDWPNRRLTLPMPPFGIETRGEDDKKPSEPVQLGAPGEIVYRAKIKLPPGYTVTPPQPVILIKTYAEYHSNYVLENDTLVGERRLIIKNAEVPLADWEDYRSFGKAVSDDASTYISLRSTSATPATAVSNPAAPFFREGVKQFENREFDAAERNFRRTIETDATYPGAHFNLGLCRMIRGFEEEALQEFQREEEITPENPRSYLFAASIHEQNNRGADAMRELRQLLKNDPNNQRAVILLGQLLQKEHKYSEAASLLARAVEEKPEISELKVQLGLAYLKAGDDARGKQMLESGLGDDPEYAALNSAAYSLADAGVALDEAKRYALEAVEKVEAKAADTSNSDPLGLPVTNDLGMIWDTLGWVFFRQGEHEKALNYVRPAWLLSQNPKIGDHLAQIYDRLGQKQLANATYKLAYASATTTFKSKKLLTGNLSPALTVSTGDPNGNGTPAEQLSNMRTFKLDLEAREPGSTANATFSIVFSPNKIDEARFVTGDPQLARLSDKLAASKIRSEFPAGSNAQIVRRGVLTCANEGCSLVFLLPHTVPDQPENDDQ